MAGVVHVPWYATGLRHDQLAAALAEIARVSLRYGARSYAVYRYRDDLYKFLQMAEFESKEDWEDYWYGPEFIEFRALTSSRPRPAPALSRAAAGGRGRDPGRGAAAPATGG
jgi:hypothetical protein